MHHCAIRTSRGAAICLLVSLSPCLLAGFGCAALTNPVADGIPVRQLPPELLAQPKDDRQTIPLTLLRQKPVEVYKLAPGDVLGVWIEGVLGDRTQALPVHFPETGTVPPALGFPIPVREDGTVPLPLVEPVWVQGLSIEEAQRAIANAYTVKKQILPPGGERILVTLLRRRLYHVLVIRQDAPTAPAATLIQPGTRSIGVTVGAAGIPNPNRRGTGYAVDLPAYENDVLNALALTGGLPGFDAVNEIVIQRGSFKGEQDRALVMQQLQALPPGCERSCWANGLGGQIIRIPLRLRPGEVPPFRPEDVVLQTGDILFIEARQAELYYTAGLLPAGEYLLPRDHDLDVLQAILRVGGPVVSGGLNTINLTGSLISEGIGFPSPSLVAVLRRTPGGGQARIRVDLNRALREPSERILIQPGDVVVLQETPCEALTRYFTQVFRFNILAHVIRGRDVQGITTLTVP